MTTPISSHAPNRIHVAASRYFMRKIASAKPITGKSGDSGTRKVRVHIGPVSGAARSRRC